MESNKEMYLKRIRLVWKLIDENYSLNDAINVNDIKEAVRVYENQSQWVRVMYRQIAVLKDKLGCLESLGVLEQKSDGVYIFINKIEESALEDMVKKYYHENISTAGRERPDRIMDNTMKGFRTGLRSNRKARKDTRWG